MFIKHQYSKGGFEREPRFPLLYPIKALTIKVNTTV